MHVATVAYHGYIVQHVHMLAQYSCQHIYTRHQYLLSIVQLESAFSKPAPCRSLPSAPQSGLTQSLSHAPPCPEVLPYLLLQLYSYSV